MKILPQDHRKLGWTPFAWLIYLVFPLMHPLLSREVRDWWLALGAIVLFLPLYFVGFWRQGRSLLPIMGGILLIGVLLSPLNGGASCFFIYAAGFAAGVGPPRTALGLIAGIVALVGLEAWLVGIPNYGWVAALVFAPIVGGVNVHYAEVGRSDAKLRLAQEEVERLATVAERERIARDLHDLLGHTLSTITLKAQVAARLATARAGEAAREMREVEEISREALAEVRRAVRNYRHSRLGSEISKAKVALEAAGVPLELESAPYELPAEIEDAAALALREAVTNVVRHAGARRCHVALAQEGKEFHLTVSDDGRGGEAPEGSGLKGMRERVESLGGSLVREVGLGTRLIVKLPTWLARDRRRAAG